MNLTAVKDYEKGKEEATQASRDIRDTSKRALLNDVAAHYRMGWRTTQLVLYYRRSPATVMNWLSECERFGLIPKRAKGRPKTKHN